MKSFVFLLVFLLSSCGSLTVPDVPLCTELTTTSGYCVHTISAKEYRIDETNLFNGKTWWELRPLMIQVPADSWKEIKKFIITVCAKTEKCDQEITEWKRAIEKIDAISIK